MTIEVEEQKPRPGRCIMCACIGPSMDVYAIFVDGADTYYYVEDVLVSREVFLDARGTAELDRWCPNCADGEVEQHPHNVPTGEVS